MALIIKLGLPTDELVEICATRSGKVIDESTLGKVALEVLRALEHESDTSRPSIVIGRFVEIDPIDPNKDSEEERARYDSDVGQSQGTMFTYPGVLHGTVLEDYVDPTDAYEIRYLELTEGLAGTGSLLEAIVRRTPLPGEIGVRH